MSLAALREVRRLFPDHHLAVLAKPWVAGLFESQDLVDEVLYLSDRGRWARLIESRPAMKRFKRAILFQNAFEAALQAFCAGIPNRIGYATDGRSLLLTQTATPRIKSLHRHQVYYYLDLLYQTGLSPINYLENREFVPDIHLSPSGEAENRSAELLEELGVDPNGPLIGLNPGAYYGSAKRWFTDRYASLAQKLIDAFAVQVLIFGSAGEARFGQEISDQMKDQPYLAAGRTDLSMLLWLLSRCQLLITNDSGPMHLAAALNVPQVALFGSTDEVATGPFSRRAHVIHKHVECSPCLLRECPIDLRCFTRIEVDEVFDLCRKILEEDVTNRADS